MKTIVTSLSLMICILGHSQWEQLGTDIDGTNDGDEFGRAISLNANGSIVAIGGPNHANDAGHVQVFENLNGDWVQIGNDIIGEEEGDDSGIAISIDGSGTVVAIGASGNSSAFGHVRVYENVNGTWTQIGDDIDGEGIGDRSGGAISISNDGSIVAIGARLNDGNGGFSGHVRVYENINNSWEQIGDDIDGENTSDFAGRGVSLNADGSILAVGSDGNDDNGSNSGHVRVFENVNGTWTQIGNAINGEATNDDSGANISLNAAGNILAIGAIGNDGNGSFSGHTRVYENNSDVWEQIGGDIDGETPGDLSGISVSLNATGNVLAVGSQLNDGNGENAGHARIFLNQNGNWIQVGDDIEGTSNGDFLGIAVSLNEDGSTVAVGGSFGNNTQGANSGHVRVFNNETLGIPEITLNEVLQITQNASSIIINSSNQGIKRVQLTDLTGRIVRDIYLPAEPQVGIINKSGLSRTMYILSIQHQDNKLVTKIISY